jgi:hypothetical protein
MTCMLLSTRTLAIPLCLFVDDGCFIFLCAGGADNDCPDELEIIAGIRLPCRYQRRNG